MFACNTTTCLLTLNKVRADNNKNTFKAMSINKVPLIKKQETGIDNRNAIKLKQKFELR
jgi:hypothetical protein